MKREKKNAHTVRENVKNPDIIKNIHNSIKKNIYIINVPNAYSFPTPILN